MLDQLEAQAPDALLALIKMHAQDPRADKIDLGVGVYRTNDGATPVFRSIKAAEQRLVDTQDSKSYLGPEGDTGFVDAERLWEMTKENANSAYFKEGGFRLWRDKQMAVLLSSAQFAPGLQVCDGVAYPINIEINMVVCNRHVDISAIDVAGGAQAGTAIDKQMHRIIPDRFLAQAQATAIFTKIVLATTETSATTNAMNYPLDSAERLLNAAGQMR